MSTVATRQGVSPRLRFRILKRDNFSCVYCGRRPPDVELEVDHVVASASGGGSEESNLVAACVDCNSGKSDAPLVKMELPSVVTSCLTCGAELRILALAPVIGFCSHGCFRAAAAHEMTLKGGQ